MADSYIQIPTDDVGKKVRTYETMVAGQTTHVHYFIPQDETGNRVVYGASGTAPVDATFSGAMSGVMSVSGPVCANVANALSGVVSVSGTVGVTQSAGWTISVNNAISGVVSVSGPVCANVANAISGVVSVSGTVGIASPLATITTVQSATVYQGTSPWTVSATNALSGVVSVSGPVCANVANAVSGVVSVSGPVCANVANAISGVVSISGTVGIASPIATITTVQSSTVYQGTSPWVVTGTINAVNSSVASAFSAAPGKVTYVGGYDGTNVVPMKVDASGIVAVTGTINATNPSVKTAFSAAPSQAAYIGGYDGTNVVPVKVDASGIVAVAGTFSSTTPFSKTSSSGVPSQVAYVGGYDGVNAVPISVDAAGRVNVSAEIDAALSGVVSVSGPVCANVANAISGVVSVSGTVGITSPLATITTVQSATVYQGTSPWVVTGAVSQVGNWTVSISSPVATITTVQSATVYQGTSPWVDRPQNVATANSAIPGFVGYMGGTDGTNIRAISVDSSGRQWAQGVATANSAVPGFINYVGGTDGTNIRALAVRTTGDLRNIATANSAVPGFVAVVGGSDGTNTPPLALRAGGDLRHVATTASAVPGFVALVGGTDGTNIRPLGVTTSGMIGNVGNVGHDDADSGNAIKVGSRAMIATYPTAVAALDRTDQISDKYGIQVVYPYTTRDNLRGSYATVTTTETTVLAASAGNYMDLLGVYVQNQSTSEVQVTIKDGTAGTTKFIIPMRSLSVGGMAFPIPWPASGTSANWTAQLSTTATVAVSMQGIIRT